MNFQNSSKKSNSKSFKSDLQNHSGITFLDDSTTESHETQQTTQHTQIQIIFFTYRSSPEKIYKSLKTTSGIVFYLRDHDGNWNQIDEIPPKKDIYIIKNIHSYLNKLN